MRPLLESCRVDLQCADCTKRAAAAEECAKIGAEAVPLACELAMAASDADPAVREWAVAALEELGAPRVEACDRLVQLLAGEHDTAFWAATLLGRLKDVGAPALDALAAAFCDRPESTVRQRLAWALGQIGSAAAPAVDALKSAAEQTEDSALRRAARQAIDRIQ